MSESNRNVSPYLWVVLGCTALTIFFSLVSISLRTVRRVQLEEAFKHLDPSRLEMFERHLPALRLAASLWRSLANLVLVVAMMYLFEVHGQGWGPLVLAVAAAGAIIAVFALAIPNAWASHAGERVLAATLPVIMFLRYALYPVIATLQAFETPVRRLSGIPDSPPDQEETVKQEILHAATEGQAEGTVQAEEVEMIESVMEFADTRAGEIMTPRTDIFAIPVQTPWADACHQVSAAGHSRVPAYDGDLDNIIGILYAKDLLQHVGGNEKIALNAILRKPFFVPITKPLDDLLREFKARKVHIAVVLDEYGGTAGLVTIEDVLEEIVGEIADEYDLAQPALMKRIDERVAEVDGRMYIDDINKALGLHVPEDEDYDTIAGFVFSELGYIPTPGETLESSGAKFTVIAANERKISRLRVEIVPETKKSEETE